MDYLQLLFTTPNPLQTYALVFLLGSLTVSSLSDLKRMAAQADFAEVWAAYTAIMFISDAYLGATGQLNPITFTIKWAMILVAAAITTQTRIADISTMDTAAQTALLATLNPAYIILTITLTILTNELLKPILQKYGEAGAYPYLPTILTVNLLILIITQTNTLETATGLTPPA